MPITLRLDGKHYTAVPTDVFDRMVAQLGGELPEFPSADAHGRHPARDAGRVVLARKLVKRRIAAGLTQQQVAKRAGVRVETISRLEAGKHQPRTATLQKLDEALSRAGA